MDLQTLLHSGRPVLLDGAMGTMLQNKGLAAGQAPETMNLNNGDAVQEVHEAYLKAGSDMVLTNTFGANACKMSPLGLSVQEVVERAVKLAQQARDASGKDAWIGLDMGPTGQMLYPMGTLSFEEAYALYREQAIAGAAAGADFAHIETMSDLLELKAAVLAVRENTSLPVMCTMTVDKSLRTFTGCHIGCMAAAMEALGVVAVGVNCSLGPQDLVPVVRELARYTDLPLIVKPNAGLPVLLENGETTFDVTPEQFGEWMAPYCAMGAVVLGGCCGTSPDHIRCLADSVRGLAVAQREPVRGLTVCTASKAVTLGDGVKLVGQRINPSGNAMMTQAVCTGDFDTIVELAIDQLSDGADMLDVNVFVDGVDEVAAMREAVAAVQAACHAPLLIDSMDPAALEAGLRVYSGKPVLNSVPVTQKAMETLLPLAKRYGAAVVGMTLSEAGIPRTAQERLALAQRFIDTALSYGIPRRDILIDCVTQAHSMDPDSAWQTLQAVQALHAQGVYTILGIGNVSYGQRDRAPLEAMYANLCVHAGADAIILNPASASVMDAVEASGLA